MGDERVPRLEIVEWADRFGLVAGVTTRQDGFSLGLWSDEPTQHVMTRWRAFRRVFEPRFPTVVLGLQIHGTALNWIDHAPAGWLITDGVDGHISRQPGTLLTITIADCVPVYLFAPGYGLMALLHAGWRGVAGGILERALGAITSAAGVPSADIVMHCGVSICGSCYEVSSEVGRQLTGSPVEGDRCRVDLRAILAGRAAALGVGEITVSTLCSAHNNDTFFSHRASRGQDGRMLAYLGMPT